MLTLCSPADIYWCFNTTCTFCYPQLKAADSYKMTVNFCQTVWCHAPEDTGLTKLELHITGEWKILYIISTNIQWKSTTIKVTIVWRPVIKANNCYSQICVLQHIHTFKTKYTRFYKYLITSSNNMGFYEGTEKQRTKLKLQANHAGQW